MAFLQPLAFLPSVPEGVMDELRTTEGMLFRDEGAKKLFLDIKSLVLESLGSAQATFAGELYETVLDRYVAWDAAVAHEELQRADAHFRDIAVRITPVTVLYAKYLYAGAAPLRIRKPRINALLRGMFTRLARLRSVRTGTFFELSPLQQDFVLRDMFRQTLATDCISIVPPAAVLTARAAASVNAVGAHATAVNAVVDADADDDANTAVVHPAPAAEALGPPFAEAAAHAVVEDALGHEAAEREAAEREAAEREAAEREAAEREAAERDAAERESVAAPPSTIVHTKPDDAATQAFAREMQDDNDVYPDDSISRVLDRGSSSHTMPSATMHSSFGAAGVAGGAAPAAREHASVASHASVRSRVSHFHMPKDVRRVLITDAESEAGARTATLSRHTESLR